MCQADADRSIIRGPWMLRNPASRVIDRVALPEWTREDCGIQSGHRDRHRVAQKADVFVGLVARPRIAIPNAARDQWIMIAGDDEHGTRHRLALKQSESAFGNRGPTDAVIVEKVTGDEHE